MLPGAVAPAPVAPALSPTTSLAQPSDSPSSSTPDRQQAPADPREVGWGPPPLQDDAIYLTGASSFSDDQEVAD